MEQLGLNRKTVNQYARTGALAVSRLLVTLSMFLLTGCQFSIVDSALQKSTSVVRGIQNLPSTVLPGQFKSTAFIDSDFKIPDASIEPDGDYTVIRTFFATNRSLNPTAETETMFGQGRRSETTFGKSYVILRRSSDTFDIEPDSLIKVAINNGPEEPATLAHNEIISGNKLSDTVNTQINRSGNGRALIFVHGFNVSFEEAAIRTAQLSYDLGFSGTPFFFSWPARGDSPSYVADVEMARSSQQQFEAMFTHVLSTTTADKIYLIAHGMGAGLLGKAMKNVFLKRPEFRDKVKEIILVAADISADEFTRDLAPWLGTADSPITLYASGNDPSLKISKSFNNDGLAGDDSDRVLIVNGVETIDAGEVDTSLAGHAAFTDSNSVVGDIWDLIQNGSRASARSQLTARYTAEGTYWEYRR